MYYLNGVLVVEGKCDKAFLSTFIKTNYFVTNGFDLHNSDIKFLIDLSKETKIFILTDPDDAGERISNRLKNEIPNAIVLKIDFKNRKQYHKHGVAECDKSEIINILKEYLSDIFDESKIFNTSLLINLGINNSDIRNYIADKLNLGNCYNNKVLIDRLNLKKIEIKEIERIVKEYGN